MKTSSGISRRALLQGTSIAAAAAWLCRGSRTAHADPAQRPCVVTIFLSGGHNAFFGSADSFVTNGSFGVTSGNILDAGSGVFVDRGTFGTMPAVALSHMASIGVKHGLSSHTAARPALWNHGGKAAHVLLAKAMGGDAAIKCAAIGSLPPGPNLAEGDVSVQLINDLAPTLSALGATTSSDPRRAARDVALTDLRAATSMSQRSLSRSPGSLRSVADGYASATGVLARPAQAISYADLAPAYGMATTRTALYGDFRMHMLAAEVMVHAGANVVAVRGPGLDSHGDVDGVDERSRMSRIMAGLNIFLTRTLAMTNRNVVTVIFSDFSRSLPGSDHAPNLTATVIGNKVKQGTTGKVTSAVALPAGTPGIPGFWAYVAKAAGVTAEPFGANPHPLVLA